MNKKRNQLRTPVFFSSRERDKKYNRCLFNPNKKIKKVVLRLNIPLVRKMKKFIAELEILELVKETVIYTKDPHNLDTISKEEIHHVNKVLLQVTKRKLKVKELFRFF